MTYYDQEETPFTPDPGDPVVSPPIQGTGDEFVLHRETNVITFGSKASDITPDSVLGSPNATELGLEAGWIVGWVQATMDSRYNYGTNGDIDALADPNFNDDPTAPGNPVSIDLSGVPTLGFPALEGEMGPASVGETVQYILSLDR